MSEELKIVRIYDKPYLIADISDACKEMLNASQQTNQAIGIMSTLIQAAQQGADLKFKEAIKLLPEAYEEEESEAVEPSETH